jgi:hypothetical protein
MKTELHNVRNFWRSEIYNSIEVNEQKKDTW